MEKKVAFVHGRPGPHPIHGKFAESIKSDFHFVDFRIRWHDKQSGRFKRYLSWLVCALLFPNRKKYAYFLTESMQYPPIVMKFLGLLRKNQKVIGLLDDETLYFLYSGFYSPFTRWMTLKMLASFDAVICIGKMEYELYHKVLKDRAAKAYLGFNGVETSRYNKLVTLSPALDSKNIIFIANGPSGWRAYYKGLDLMLLAFEKASRAMPEITLTIVGEWDRDYLESEILKHCPASSSSIRFVGPTKDLHTHLSNCSLYLHCGRGEAYGITILEAMAAGVVPIISEWTGAKEAVEQVSKELIFPLDVNAIAEKIKWYFAMSEEDRLLYSAKGREIIKNYTLENALRSFEEAFDTMDRDFESGN